MRGRECPIPEVSRDDVVARGAREAPDEDVFGAGPEEQLRAFPRRRSRRRHVVHEQNAARSAGARAEGVAHVAGAAGERQAALALVRPDFHEAAGLERDVEERRNGRAEEIGGVIAAPVRARGRGDGGGFVHGLGRGQAVREHPGQVRREVIGSAEFEGDQDSPRGAAIGRRGPEAPEGRRIEKAASAAQGIFPGLGSLPPLEGFIADSAARLWKRRQGFPARLADAAAQEALDTAFAARETARGEQKVRGRANEGVQFSLRESRSAAVNIRGRILEVFSEFPCDNLKLGT